MFPWPRDGQLSVLVAIVPDGEPPSHDIITRKVTVQQF